MVTDSDDHVQHPLWDYFMAVLLLGRDDYIPCLWTLAAIENPAYISVVVIFVNKYNMISKRDAEGTVTYYIFKKTTALSIAVVFVLNYKLFL